MKNLIERYVQFAVRRHKLVVLLAIVVLLGSLGISSQLAVDSSLDSMLPEGNEVIDAMVTMEEEFGAQEHVIVVVQSNDNVSAAIEYVEALAARIQEDNLAAGLMYKVDLGEGEPQYISSESESLFLITVTPNINMANIMDERDDFFQGLFSAVDETLERSEFRELDAGVTGGSLIQDYESADSLAVGFLLAGVITLILIIALLILSFKRLFLPFTTVLPLLLGVTITAAFAAIAFGSLNVFSISFAVLLLGMGIDYAVHILSRYGEQRTQGDSIEQALVHTLEKTGLSMFIASVTTALAFMGFMFAQMKGFSQMGIISAIGIFFALISQLMVTPAMIAWADLRRKHTPQKDQGFKFMKPIGSFVSKHHVVVVIITVILLAGAFSNVLNTEVDGDVSALTPSDLPSTQWLEIVQSEFDYNPDEIIMMANDLDELAAFTQELSQMDTVAGFESVAAYLPEDKALWESTLPLLPDVLTENYIGNTGKFLISVSANGNVWDGEFMAELRQGLFSLTSNVSGIPILMDEFVGMMVDDTFRISIIAGLAIFVVLMLMFRNFKYAFSIMIAIFGSLYLLLGILTLFNLQLTILNIIGLPLIIGIGVGNAVHVANRIRHTGDTTYTLVHTGKAVIISSVTTIFAFGSLIFSGYPGLIGLGLLVVLGLGISLILNLTLLPAILGFRLHKKEQAQAS